MQRLILPEKPTVETLESWLRLTQRYGFVQRSPQVSEPSVLAHETGGFCGGYALGALYGWRLAPELPDGRPSPEVCALAGYGCLRWQEKGAPQIGHWTEPEGRTIDIVPAEDLLPVDAGEDFYRGMLDGFDAVVLAHQKEKGIQPSPYMAALRGALVGRLGGRAQASDVQTRPSGKPN
jgi:hypothetical protein